MKSSQKNIKMHRSVLLLLALELVLLCFVTETQQGKESSKIRVQTQESADLIFLIDGSNNLSHDEFQFIRSFIASFIEDLNIGPNAIQIAVVQYSNTPLTEFYLNTYHTRTEVLKAVKSLRQKGGGETNIGLALQFLIDSHFITSAGSRAADEVPQVMVLITSRPSSDDVRSGVFSIKKRGTFTFAVGVKDAEAVEVKTIATDPSFTMVVPDVQQMASVQQQLMSLFSLVAKKQLVIEMQETKVEAQVSKRDIIFLVDGSSSVGNANFLEISKFILNMVNKFVIGPNSVQVAVVQYSEDVMTEFYLNTHTTQSAVQSALKRLKMKGGWEVNTGAALDYVFKNHFTRAAGSRKEDGVPQLLVVITGEKSVDDVKLPAETLKRAAVMTLAIGVKDADLEQMKEIAIDPSLVFNVEKFQNLPEIKDRVLTPLSTLAGVIINYEPPTKPSKKEADKRDIVFLVDGSYSSGRKHLSAIKNFIKETVEALDIGSDATQVGLVQYSDISETVFFLNTYSSKDDILSQVRRLRLRGGTVLKTGEALNYVLKYLFTKYSGSRKEEGVPQFLVLITGGESRDDVKQPSDALSRAGVTTLAIGFENARKQQLKDISSDPSLVFEVKETHSIPKIEQDLLLPLSTLNGRTQTSELPISPTSKENADPQERDIVFLIDGSSRVAESFPVVREFLRGIIQQLDIGENRSRVAVVQFSEKARVEIPLSAHSARDDLMATVDNLRPVGGKRLNMGAALEYVARNVFSVATGSRRDAGVPQILVLLTSGKSKDKVRKAVAGLKRAAIVTFTIGVAEADSQELKEIAHSPNLMFAVKDFKSLPEIQDQLLQPLKSLIIEIIKMPSGITEGHKRDVVFLIDGSFHVGTYFYFIRDLIINLIPNFDIAKDKDQISVVQYTENARIEFPLNAFTNKEEVLAAVKRLRLKGGSKLKTGAALDFVRRNVFSKSGGGRKHLGCSQILLLITSGKSEDEVRRAADLLKRTGVVPFTVGIGQVETRELHQIAYSPKLTFQVDNYWDLSDLDLNLLSISRHLENIPIPTTISTDVDRRDIVFLIDGSSKIGKGFQVVRKFMARIVESFNVGKRKVQFGVVQFSENPRTEFLLNTHSNKKKVLVAIKKLRLKRGKKLNIGLALEHVMKNVFISSAGSRIDNPIPQILVLLTSGKSNDATSQQTDQLRELGIVTFGIGVKEADSTVLEPLAYSSSLAFPVKTFPALFNFWNQLQQIMKTVAVEVVD
ncbi:collagen alpha-3(VI) chain-like isoform X5 [Narcine bancroftii]|uniref:collagen alpha-3(VI) chain-like isoform X5 n=1 Tax=Narcine bancroftii TaxID=1343680 RepID=UPI003832070A